MMMKSNEVDQEQVISDFDEDEAGEKVFKFNIDVWNWKLDYIYVFLL